MTDRYVNLGRTYVLPSIRLLSSIIDALVLALCVSWNCARIQRKAITSYTLTDTWESKDRRSTVSRRWHIVTTKRFRPHSAIRLLWWFQCFAFISFCLAAFSFSCQSPLAFYHLLSSGSVGSACKGCCLPTEHLDRVSVLCSDDADGASAPGALQSSGC